MSSGNDNNSDNHVRHWESAIYESIREIRRAKARISELEKSIKIFRRKISSREPWPGESATLN
jgi:hypothetical protein